MHIFRDDARGVPPQDQWRGLASGISGSGRFRYSIDGGRSYIPKHERLIDAQLPGQPAAVMIYDKSGATRTFVIDLDTSKGGRQAVERDFAAVCALLERAGVRYFADESPNGGRHVYVPLEVPLPHPVAGAAARALAARTPTMDPLPMLTAAGHACIRPPGSRHGSTGGHQQLIGSLSHAYDVLRRPTSAEAWTRLVDEIDVDAFMRDDSADRFTLDPDRYEQLPVLGRWTAPDSRYQAIAREGTWKGYQSPSEARQAVVWACVASGWSFADVARRLKDGTWRGLAGMYGRYRPHQRGAALGRDWNAALRFEKRRRETTGMKSVHVGNTSPKKTQGGAQTPDIRAFVDAWLNAVYLEFHATRDQLSTRAVLTAMAEAAVKTGSSTIEFGVRHLALASGGVHYATVSKILKQLQDAPRPLITKTRDAKGVRADAWTLVIPEDLVDHVEHMSKHRGRVHGVRPAFRALGLVACFVHDALEQAQTPTRRRDLAEKAGVSERACHEALQLLAAYGLARRDTPAGWTLGTGSLDQLAEALGIDEQIRDQIRQYRRERDAWWTYLGIIRLERHDTSVGTYETPPPPDVDEPPWLDPPPEPGATLMDLLERELGAHLIAVDIAG